MAPIQVSIKHAGKVHPVDLDTDLPPNAFKEAIYQVTGVPVDRMKVMIKGGVLKDDTPWKKVAPKPGMSFMVIGAAGELPKPPEKPIVFLEDMDDSQLAEALAMPVGLRNLGNTCYMNASIQALRAIPELQIALSAPALQSTTPLPSSLRDLYASMSRTSDTVTPLGFLSTLRQVNPQFAEMDRREKSGMAMAMGGGAGYAQQDAEECWGQIVQTLGNVPGLSRSGGVPGESELAVESPKRFVEQWLMGEMRRELTCDEAPEEAKSVAFENFLKIECNITGTTNFMLTGIMNSLDQKVEKRSATLGRDAVYSQKTRVTRLPGYLVVHMVRFAWRQDIMKKAKIMRKVKFPTEFDALDLATDELRTKLLPVSRKLKDFERERGERRKVRKRTKTKIGAASSSTSIPEPPAPTAVPTADVEMGDAAAQVGGVEPVLGDATVERGRGIVLEGDSKPAAAGSGDALGDEVEYRMRELEELEKLIDESVKQDVGASVHGLYELVSIVTHKGPAADAGHYMGFVKKSVFHKPSAISSTGISGPSTSAAEAAQASSAAVNATQLFDEEDEDWYKFDDDKVSVFPVEKLATLDGGGEDSSAYLLVYKSKSLV